MRPQIQFRVLGSVEIVADDRPLRLDRPQRRAVLAYFLLHAGRTITSAELMNALWGDDLPDSAQAQIYSLVFAVRKALRDASFYGLASAPGGYRLDTTDEQTDLDIFTRKVKTAKGLADSPQTAGMLLREALALWRGEPLSGVSADFAEPARVQLRELYLATWEQLLELDLAAGLHRETTSELAALCAAHPLRERLVEMHMLALYRCGQTARALEVYRDFCTRLETELGLDPGPLLSAMQLAILRREPELDPPPARPLSASASAPKVASLPADMPDFVGRVEAMSQLDAWAAGEPPHAPILITGGAGVGKTALAIHFGHHQARLHDVEHLYVNLRGYSGDQPMQPIEALAYFLGCLGVAPHDIPVDPTQAAARYRSLLAGRKSLVILDNAISSDQIRPLLPGVGDALVIVTGRDRLSGLVARESARRVSLAPFSEGESLELLNRMVDGGLPEFPAREISVLCGHLPLALRVAGANLADGLYNSVTELLTAAADGGWPDLVELDDDVASGTRITFDHSYRRLTEPEQELFRLLSIVPGPDFSPAAAAALISREVRATEVMVRRLSAAHLLERGRSDRYSQHDLVRRYARSICELQQPPATLSGLRQRLYNHYLRVADAAARLVAPQILRLPNENRFNDDAPGQQTFADAEGAMRWLDEERASLVATIQDAVHHGYLETAWVLSDALRGYFSIRRHMGDWLRVAGLALSAAQSAQNVAGEVSARLSLSMAQWFLGERQDAIDALSPAVGLALSIGWRNAATSCLTNLGGICGDWGRLEQAVGYLSRALETHPPDGPVATKASILSNLGAACSDSGRLAESVAHKTAAIELFTQMGSELGVARNESNLGESLLILGDYAAARLRLESAVSTLEHLPDRYSHASALVWLGWLHRALGDSTTAAQCAHRSIDMAAEIRAKNFVSSGLSLLAVIEQDPVRHQHAVDAARECNSGIAEAQALTAAAQTFTELGRFAEARARCAEAIELSCSGGYRNVELAALVQLAELHELQGETGQAQSIAKAADALARQTGCTRFATRLRPLL